MFSFFKKKKPEDELPPASEPSPSPAPMMAPGTAEQEVPAFLRDLPAPGDVAFDALRGRGPGAGGTVSTPASKPLADAAIAPAPAAPTPAAAPFLPPRWTKPPPAAPLAFKPPPPVPPSAAVPPAAATDVPAFLRDLPPAPTPSTPPADQRKPSPYRAAPPPEAPGEPERAGWLAKLKTGLKKTGTGIQAVFVNAQIDEDLYEELETALLMADAGVKATEQMLEELRRRVKSTIATDAAQVRVLLADVLTDLLKPLEKQLVIGEHTPTVIMVAGVNGAGKTTSIGKLTKHLADEGCAVLLAAADTFRAAAREQLLVWADRNTVEIVSNEGGDPSSVSFDAVKAGKARGKDVVLVDTAGRLPTQIHLMDELKKIKRVVTKADASAPHEVLLVIDGNTGQNAVAQVKAFDDALGLTGLIVTKLDGTAKGGVLAAIARERPIPVYFVGVGEKLEDLETFSAREFAQALLG
ncbi:signal recognition particle-docking protein FtsY [Variovorax sp. dw_954]|uniref:signal recognition particle-docking protein FtsY n=1 Tax=Variovorax sp. dw_954 TaxID=2720078 RepID=UPI0021163B6C|nr:signal recognition particle-docking protein FtsY [Variovorax sp. dw_954]